MYIHNSIAVTKCQTIISPVMHVTGHRDNNTSTLYQLLFKYKKKIVSLQHKYVCMHVRGKKKKTKTRLSMRKTPITAQ